MRKNFTGQFCSVLGKNRVNRRVDRIFTDNQLSRDFTHDIEVRIQVETLTNKPLSQAMSLHWSSSFSFINMSLIPYHNKIFTVREFAFLDDEFLEMRNFQRNEHPRAIIETCIPEPVFEMETLINDNFTSISL